MGQNLLSGVADEQASGPLGAAESDPEGALYFGTEINTMQIFGRSHVTCSFTTLSGCRMVACLSVREHVSGGQYGPAVSRPIRTHPFSLWSRLLEYCHKYSGFKRDGGATLWC